MTISYYVVKFADMEAVIHNLEYDALTNAVAFAAQQSVYSPTILYANIIPGPRHAGHEVPILWFDHGQLVTDHLLAAS